jgi:4-aminobutyrate aminotransferase
MMKNADVALRRTESIARGVGMQTQIYVDKALNSEVWDIEGNRYIDFAAGIAVVNTGHRHPKVIEAVHKQLERFTHTCHQVLPYENYIHLAERLNAIVPGDFDKKTVFVTTGAEAVENAIKVARYATGRIVLFVPKGSTVKADPAFADLHAALDDGRLRRLAIANPEPHLERIQS